MIKEFETELYKDNTKFLLIFIVLDLALIGLFIYIGRTYKLNFAGLVLPMFLVMSPIIFSKKIKQFFKRKVILNFSETTFRVRCFSPKTNMLTNEEEYFWHDIGAYRFYFSPKQTTSLTLYLKNRKRRTFIFLESRTFDEATEGESVLSIFLNCVRIINEGLPTENKIKPRGGFIVSKMALEK